LRVEYGTVAAAGTILRRDVLEPNKLVVGSPPKGGVIDFIPRAYSGLRRVVEKNIHYLANLAALEAWYLYVRRPFLHEKTGGEALWSGAIERLRAAKEERIKRIKGMCANMMAALEKGGASEASARQKRELNERMDELAGLFLEQGGSLQAGAWDRDEFLSSLESLSSRYRDPYVQSIQALPEAGAAAGTRWLEKVVEDRCGRASSMIPSMRLFKGRGKGAARHG
ncbi:MAG: hypothetical protein ACLFUE_08685, partial [Desulfobacteraceae bacterium]